MLKKKDGVSSFRGVLVGVDHQCRHSSVGKQDHPGGLDTVVGQRSELRVVEVEVEVEGGHEGAAGCERLGLAG